MASPSQQFAAADYDDGVGVKVPVSDRAVAVPLSAVATRGSTGATTGPIVIGKGVDVSGDIVYHSGIGPPIPCEAAVWAQAGLRFRRHSAR